MLVGYCFFVLFVVCFICEKACLLMCWPKQWFLIELRAGSEFGWLYWVGCVGKLGIVVCVCVCVCGLIEFLIGWFVSWDVCVLFSCDYCLCLDRLVVLCCLYWVDCVVLFVVFWADGAGLVVLG